MGVSLFVGRLVVFHGRLVRIRGSHALSTGQICYDLEWFSLSPLFRGFDCGAAVAEELIPLTGSLYFLLSCLESGHRVCLDAGIAVHHYYDGEYRVILRPPMVSDPVFYPVSTPGEVFALVGHSYASDLQWELQ